MTYGALGRFFPVLVHCLAAFACLLDSCALAQTIDVAFPNRPPLVNSVDGKPTGILTDLARNIFQKAGFDVRFTEMPTARILAELEKKDSMLCSYGWFKNPERSSFARYTLPIFKDTGLNAVFLKKHEALFLGKGTFQELVRDKSLSLGLVRGFSHGQSADKIIKNGKPSVIECLAPRQQALMLANERFFYMLARGWELEEISRLSGKDMSELAMMPLEDLQENSERYILCGRGVPQEVIDRLNAAIVTLVPEAAPKAGDSP